jgi:hypothetical protein
VRERREKRLPHTALCQRPRHEIVYRIPVVCQILLIFFETRKCAHVRITYVSTTTQSSRNSRTKTASPCTAT